MKKLNILIFFLAFSLISTTISAQRSAYIDMDKILNALPEYKNAQSQLEQKAERWRQEIEKERQEVEKMYRDYQVREPLMSDDMRKKKQEEIMTKEQSFLNKQKQYFGPDGELFKKRQSLVKPIQERVYDAIQKIAKSRNYDFIFNAPDGATLIYAKDSKDISDEVIKKIK